MQKREIGFAGETAACEYLSKKGYLIERRNYSQPYGEVDIIAIAPDGCRVFVEVKTRKNSNYGYPSEFVDRRKMERIRKTAFSYCGECYMRFDIIEVYYSMIGDRISVNKINHIEDAF